MLSSVLPSSVSDNAGGRYVYSVVSVLESNFDVYVVVPNGAAARRARDAGRVPEHKLVSRASILPPGRTQNIISRISSILFPVSIPLGYVFSVLSSPELRLLIRKADVIDLQWQEQGLLIPFLRILNPRAKIICTLHDVLSQRFERAANSSSSILKYIRWKWAFAFAKISEILIVVCADTMVVLTDKDARLAPKIKRKVSVITPTLTQGLEKVDRSRPGHLQLLYVGSLSRWENEEGLLWFLTEIWPTVRKQAPSVNFRVVGGGAGEQLLEAMAKAGVQALGFTPNLEPLYEQTTVVVAPMRLGAGVKFKVIDALIAGVPVVTTPVGAEGIGESSWFAGVHSEPLEFAAKLIDILSDPEESFSQAKRIREVAIIAFGDKQFEKSIKNVYKIW